MHTHPAEIEETTAAILARVRVDSRALTVERVTIAKRDGVWQFTAADHTGVAVLTGTAAWRHGRRVIVTLTQPVAGPDRARMARLGFDGLAAYATHLLDDGRDADALAVYDEIERRDRAERAAARVVRTTPPVDDRDRPAPVAFQRRGQSRRDALREAYAEWNAARYEQAERACRGHMVNRAGRDAGISARDLFAGPARVARKYASRELLEWWAEHGRQSFDAWSDTVAGSAAARARHATASNGRDFI
jgi:hypothetical protein